MAEAWLLWAAATTAVWGIGTITSKPATDFFGPRIMFLAAAGTEALTFGLLGLSMDRLPLPADSLVVATALLAGAAGMTGYLMFYEGLNLGSVGLVGTVTAAYPMVTVALGVIVLGEGLTAVQACGVALMIFCVLLLAAEPRGSGGKRRAAVVLSVLGFLAWGLWGFLAKVSVDVIGEANVFVLYAGGAGCVGLAYAAWRRVPRPTTDPPSRRIIGIALTTTFAGAAGVFTLIYAYAAGPASLVTPVTGSYPIVATIGAALLLREKLRWRTAAALVAFGIGITLVSWA